jgi:hypothetical protein
MARFFHVAVGDAVKVGKKSYKANTSYRITEDIATSLFDLSKEGVVSLTDYPISFDDIREAKKQEEANKVVFDKAKTKKVREKEEKEKEEKEKEEKEKEEKETDEDAVFDPVVKDNGNNKKK